MRDKFSRLNVGPVPATPMLNQNGPRISQITTDLGGYFAGNPSQSAASGLFRGLFAGPVLAGLSALLAA
jgi:hypothetical protein